MLDLYWSISPLAQVGVIITALFSIGVLFGVLGFSWGALKDIFGGIPFVGKLFSGKKACTKVFSIFLIVSILLLGSMIFVTTSSQGAAGTTGDMEVGTESFVPDQPLVIYLDDLTAGGSYDLNFTTGCHDSIAFTLGASQTEIHFTVLIASPTSGDTCLITLSGDGSATIIDSVLLSENDAETWFPTDLLISLGILVLIVSIIVGIVVSVRHSRG